jgi:predicted metal-dependent hydrolase
LNSYPKAYREYLIYFQAERDYFECHEVMEAYWKQHREDPRSLAYVGLIQLAVGLYHQRRGNMAGAVKMLQSAWNHLSEEHIESLGMHPQELRESITERINQIKMGIPLYEDMDLPIQDTALLKQCQQECLTRGLIWSNPSDCSNEHLLHKHKLRDRTEVIEERNQQVLERQRKKGVSS